MPKKTKTTKKDKSVKQTVKQSVVVHVNTDGKSKSKSGSRKKPANVRSFTKGASYMGGTPLRALNYPSNNIVVNVPQSQPQPIFMSDIVNRVSALENVRRSQLADEQQAKSIVTPMATQTPTANKPISDMLPTPRLLQDDFITPPTQKPIASVEDFDKKKEEHVNDIKSIMRMSADFKEEEQTPTGLSPIMEEYSTPYKTPFAQLPSVSTPTPSDMGSPTFVNPAFSPIAEEAAQETTKEKAPRNKWGGKREGAGRLKNATKMAAAAVEENVSMRRKREALDAFRQNVMRKKEGYDADSEE